MVLIKRTSIIYYKRISKLNDDSPHSMLKQIVENQSNYWDKYYAAPDDVHINSKFGNVCEHFFWLGNSEYGCRFRSRRPNEDKVFTNPHYRLTVTRTNYESRNALPSVVGCYAVFNKQMLCLYVGKSNNVKNRLNNHFKDSLATWRDEVEKVLIWEEQPLIDRHHFEVFLIACLKPKYNVQHRSEILNRYCKPMVLLKV